jgi:hypothetical protein
MHSVATVLLSFEFSQAGDMWVSATTAPSQPHGPKRNQPKLYSVPWSYRVKCIQYNLNLQYFLLMMGLLGYNPILSQEESLTWHPKMSLNTKCPGANCFDGLGTWSKRPTVLASFAWLSWNSLAYLWQLYSMCLLQSTWSTHTWQTLESAFTHYFTKSWQ